ncbi:MAG: antitoxin VbhA family protein [Clostridiales bacterium]|nr:antitoxin VbhA family protein [Clostridiales bacterium]
MAYAPIEVDRSALTIMGVPFPDIDALENAASALGSNMYEGFVPTPSLVELLRDFIEGKISHGEIPALVKEQMA